MAGGKNKDSGKINSIPTKIVNAISSVNPEELSQIESCPSFTINLLNLGQNTDNSKKKKVEKEYQIGNYLIKRTLGQGTFGKVKLGIHLPNKEKVAIKILEKSRIVEKDDEIRVKREFDMLALFNHPNIILVAEIFESADSYYSVMEYCQGGELFNYIVKNRRLSDEESSFFYFQLINGLEYLHSLGIVHRDLKPENLLLTNEHLLKIIDFGLSNYFREGQRNLLSTPCGSPCYASPEMVAGKKYNGFKIDIWSTGIILYAMLCGYLPFEDKDNEHLFEKILECKPVFPKFISKNAKDLMEKILVTDPDKRISISEIKKHPFYLSGKELFEQDFSIYQIINDNEGNNHSLDKIEIDNILDIPELKGNNDLNQNKENLDNNLNNINSYKDKENNIKEIEIKLDKKSDENINGNKKTIIDANKNKSKENIIKKTNTYEFETKKINDRIQDKVKLIEPNKIKVKSNKDIEELIYLPMSVPKNDIPKKISFSKQLEKVSKKKLIKNSRKSNIRTNSLTGTSIENKNEIVNINKLKNRLVKIKNIDILTNFKTEKNKTNNLIKKQMNLIKKNLNQKDYSIADNINKSNKYKLKKKFQKLKFNSSNKNKKSKSISINNIKNLYHKKDRIKKNRNKIFSHGNHIHIDNKKQIKLNLLHKKNLKEINMNLKKAKKIILGKESETKDKNIRKFNSINQTSRNIIKKNNNKTNLENPDNIVYKNHIYTNSKKTNNELTIKKEKRKNNYLIKTAIKDKKEQYFYTASKNLNSYLQNMTEVNTIDVDNAKRHILGRYIKSNMTRIKTKNESDFKKLRGKILKKEKNKSLYVNIDINNKKNSLSQLINKNDNVDILNNMIKTESNHTKLIEKFKQNESNNLRNDKNLKENIKKYFKVKSPELNKNKDKINSIKSQNKAKDIINKIQIPKNLNRTSNINYHSFINNPFLSNNTIGTNKLLMHESNCSINQLEENTRKRYNEKYNSHNLKKKPLVSIRNTVINFNMIDSRLILDSLRRKKSGKKLMKSTFTQNNSDIKYQNNHLFRLCKKFNNNIFSNNRDNRLQTNDEYIMTKTKTINQNKMYQSKIMRYGDKITNKYSNKKSINNYDKKHIKFNSMRRLVEQSALNSKKKLKKLNMKSFGNTINDHNKTMSINFDLSHYKTLNNY